MLCYMPNYAKNIQKDSLYVVQKNKKNLKSGLEYSFFNP